MLMGLSQINDIDLENEKKSLNKLFECSDSFTSVVFNSGAGSGKTHALVQCLKYIISIHHDDLKNHCIQTIYSKISFHSLSLYH